MFLYLFMLSWIFDGFIYSTRTDTVNTKNSNKATEVFFFFLILVKFHTNIKILPRSVSLRVTFAAFYAIRYHFAYIYLPLTTPRKIPQNQWKLFFQCQYMQIFNSAISKKISFSLDDTNKHNKCAQWFI